jgi:hypothetical protein
MKGLHWSIASVSMEQSESKSSPRVGDDYSVRVPPNAGQRLQRALLVSYTGVGATEAQVLSMFEASRLAVVLNCGRRSLSE